jgi:hypothetical protein
MDIMQQATKLGRREDEQMPTAKRLIEEDEQR